MEKRYSEGDHFLISLSPGACLPVGRGEGGASPELVEGVRGKMEVVASPLNGDGKAFVASIFRLRYRFSFYPPFSKRRSEGILRN